MKSISSPSVTIILPVFNGVNKYLSDTLQSILDQTYQDFEFIIIDDGSTDGTFNMLSAWCHRDGRIRLLRNDENEGIIKSLNRALRHAQASVIARIDCGEVAHKKRIELQYRFLQENQEYVLVASQAHWIGINGERLYTTNVPGDDSELRKRLYLRDNVLIHPSAMFKKIEGLYYRDIAKAAEDYDYWLRLSMRGKLFILNEPLLTIRLDPDGTTYSKKILQVKTVDLVHDSFLYSLRNAHADREWVPVKLSGWEILQQRLFHLFTKAAIRNRHRSTLLYYTFKLLSGISSPSYMWKLVRMRMKRITVSNDPMFRKYLSSYKG